ncbi:immunoglobulin superfamily member 2 precursor [Mus musculus]|uniref:Immunoglobulin superfamily member 2 n=1 Tax=Mus musculus TaxID=10090 RepID=IGSF2_MOUSE|nr:immunoglobulin superfamily member 2 precursor [Mus musculus]A8E0Y8.1 RecName: Full=Immunoglobulin superfamily member 2; Short=IgSF2; AltName: Full=Glu-Trp-Ile EWI motif-containing protein 101; Short=EWI-101; AltName: CD_antigen=CD101; Flags: Precursor [Mus musculus]CAO94506.1 CD101 protein [Mus musculus]|eukprot:NP_001161378.1 immunoglobulin superfamily member 2 precursor [Mus musculus]
MACILCVASLFLSLTKFSIGQREVKIQEGPLYRAEGYPVSIRCTVSGHQGPSTQDFRWSIYLPSAPTKEVQIISTKDAGFSYAVYAQRVQSKEIYIERLQGDSVLLHISKLQMKDAGEYECHTPNTDGKYFGSYSAKTNLTVVPDTLSATMPSQTLSKKEGEPLELTCETTKATVQHTHLSLTWYLMQEGGGSQATEIVSLSKDFVLTPGSSYADRFVAGDVRLDKLGATSFRLSVGKLQPSDQGQVFCEATEWIQDPDETWTLITRKQTDQTALRIQPAARDFTVSITASSSPDEGKPLELVCLAVGRDGNPQLQGVWFLNGKEIAQTDAGGVLDLKRDYRDRASQGQLQVSKLSAQTFSLKIFSVGPEDVGTYSCEVAEVARTQMGSWQVLQRKQSPGYRVQLREPAARSVTVSAEQRTVWEGETLTLLCKAAGDVSALSVSWWLTPQDQSTPVFVAGMGQDGTVQLGVSSPGPAHRGNRRLEKVDWATFRLEIASAMVTDSGTYECRVSERLQNQAKGLQSTQKISVTVKSLKSSLRVNLMSRQPQVMLAHTFHLSCVVRANYSDLKLPFSVTWQFQPAGSGAFHRLIRIAHNGTVEWGDVLSQIHRKTKVSQSFFRSQLQIYDAAMEETGVYRCTVEVYDRDSICTSGPARVSATSNLLMITVTFPESKLSVNSSSQVQELSISSSTQIECAILSRSAGNLPLSIIWYFSSVSANASYLKILEMDQSSVVKYGDEFQTPRSKQKFYSEKVSQDLFLLNILSVEDSDQGHYHCAVEEWLLSTNDTWQKLERKTSGLTELKLRPTGSQVHVSKVNWTGNATEYGEAGFSCSLDGSGSTASLYSVTWYRGRGTATATAAAVANATATITAPAGSQMLVHLQYDGLLQYGREGSRRLQHCYRSSPTDFVLKLHRVEMEDAGIYWCRVTEWQQHGHPGKWINQASGESQRMVLRVLRSEPTVSSLICSSGPLLHFLIVCPFVMLLLLATSFLCLYRKARKLSQLSLSAKKEKALWVGMRKTSLQKEAGEESGHY